MSNTSAETSNSPKPEPGKTKVEIELDIRRAYMQRLPFCPDHRDKQAGLSCRACAIETLRSGMTRLSELIRTMDAPYEQKVRLKHIIDHHLEVTK